MNSMGKNRYTGIYKQKGRDTYWISWFVNGRRFRESTHSEDIKVAIELRAKRIYETSQGVVVTREVRTVTCDELFQDVIRDYEINDQRSTEYVQMRIDKHLSPFFGHRRWIHLTPAEIELYKANRRKEGAANGTINRELAILRRAGNLAIENGKALKPLKVKMLREAAPREGFYEYTECLLLSQHLPEELSRLPLIYFLTGWRKTEILTQLWARVDFGTCMMWVPGASTKNKKPKVYPFKAESRMHKLLLEQREYTDRIQREKGMIIPWLFHREGAPIKDWYSAWNKAHASAKLPRRVPHDLRRSLARVASLGKAPVNFSMQVMGHSTRKIFDQYAGGEIEAMRDTTSAIEEQMDKMYADHACGEPKPSAKRQHED